MANCWRKSVSIATLGFLLCNLLISSTFSGTKQEELYAKEKEEDTRRKFTPSAFKKILKRLKKGLKFLRKNTQLPQKNVVLYTARSVISWEDPGKKFPMDPPANRNAYVQTTLPTLHTLQTKKKQSERSGYRPAYSNIQSPFAPKFLAHRRELE